MMHNSASDPKNDRVIRNPPHRDEVDPRRVSSNVEAERLMVALIRQGVQTIAFGRAPSGRNRKRFPMRRSWGSGSPPSSGSRRRLLRRADTRVTRKPLVRGPL